MDNTQEKQEFDATAEKYGGEKAYNQAKESGKTALTYKQWVQVRTPSFKAWFGDWENDPENASKVVNPDTGEPFVVYHGTKNGTAFTEFSKNDSGIFFSSVDRASWYVSFGNDRPKILRLPNFSTWEEVEKYTDKYGVSFEKADPDEWGDGYFVGDEYADTPKDAEDIFLEKDIGDYQIYAVFLDIKKPKIKDAKGKYAVNFDQFSRSTKQDGLIIHNVKDPALGITGGDFEDTNYIVFNPEQIKSATDNIGTFDRQNPDIRFDLFGLPENDIATIEKDLRIAKVLQGEPVAVLNDRLAPHTGMAELRLWATEIFNAWDNHAISPEIGRIELDKHSVNGSIAHKMNPFKAEAFRSIKSVIEQGVVVSSAIVGRENHFFISAPVTIENKDDIVTVLVKQDMNTQRMYLHSVMTKENILNRNFEQANKKPLNTQVSIADTKKVSEPHSKLYSRATTEYIDRNADTEVSEPNPKLYSGDMGRILQKYLKVNISELEKELKIMENQQIEQQTTQPESELKNWIEKNGFQYSFSGIDAKVFLHRDNELIRLIVADDNRNIQLVNTSNIYKKISYDWQNTPENFAKLDNDFQTMKDSFKIIANLNEYTAANGGFSLSNPQSEKENTMNTQQQNTQPDYIWDNAGIPNALYTDNIFAFNNGYIVVISDDLEREVRQYNGFVDTLGGAIVWHKDRETAVAEYNYAVENADENSSAIYLIDNEENTDWDNPHHFEVDILNNPNWKEDLAKAMVDFAVSKEVETGLNADKEFSGSPEIVSVTRDNYAAANRYEQNAAKNPVFLEKIDNRHQPVMPFDDFVAAVMKDTGDSRDEVVELASEAFRSQYQAASGYLRGVSDGSVMYNAFDIEIDDKTYYATAPLEWAKEQARMDLSDKSWYLENARHSFLYSSLENNQWETAFHQLKAAADDYKQWRNQVCAFFNFRQPEITLQQGEWTQVAQFLGYKQELEALDNARLMIAEFTPQQAFEFLGVYQQYQRYVSLAEHNAEQGIDNTAIDKQIAALEQSLNEKVAQNLPPTENRQVMFDLFGTQMNLFDEVEKTQEQGTTTPEKNNLDDLDELHIKFTNALEELSPERQAELYPLVRDLGFEFIRLRQDCKELRAGNVEKSLNKIFELQNAIISKRQDYFVKGNDTDLAIEQAEHNRRVLMFVFKTKVGDRDFVEKLNDINYDFYKIIETHYQQTPAGQNDLFKRLDGELSRLNERLAWLRRNLETEKSFLQQAESGNVAVEIEYHKQTIDSINVAIAKNETEQNKLKLDANGFNQTPESQVLLQQLKEKFPHLWQSETQEQGISASEVPENSQKTQPENLSGSLKDLQDELVWQNLYVVQFNNQRMLKKGYDHLTEQQVIDKDNELFEKEVQAQTRAAELMNEITQIVIGDEYANAKVPFANVVVQRDDRLLSYIKKVPFDFENKPNSLDERRLALRHSMQIVFENAMDRMSENHLFVENFIDTSRATHYLADLIDKNVIKSKDELFNHIVPIFNSAEFVKNQESVEYQQWQKAIKNSLTSFSFKTKNEVIEQIERYGVSDKFVAEKRQIGVRKENYYWVAIEKQGTTTPEISANEVQQDLSGQPEKTTSSVLTKEEKAQLKAAKAALTAAKKELKGLRDEFDSKQGYSYFNTQQAEDNIVQKQVEVAELQRNYDNLYLALYGKTGELTNLEKEILSARNLFQSALFQGDDETLLKSLFGRIEIIERELKEQLNEIRGQHAELKQRQNDKQVFEFEIQSVMQDALAYFERNPHKKLYHNNQPLPLETDRDKAIAYVLKGTMVEELNGLVSQENSIIRKLRAFQKVYLSRPNDKMFLPQEVKFHNTLETAENQLMKGSIEDRAEINLTYDINTPDGEKKVRELFYGSRHDEQQAELFERVFAMAQKLGVEVRHALRDSGENKEINKTVLGQYSLDKNSARVKHNGYIKPEQKGEVLLHELVHSVTSRAMLLKEQGHTELLNPAQVKAIDEIEKIYKIVLDKAEELGFEKYQKATKDDKETFVGDYGLKNSHEFIAELANPVFREKLKQVAMFDDTVKAMTEVATGVEKTETAYDRLTAALYQIMDNYEPDFGVKYEQAKYGNIKMHDMNGLPEKENQMEQTTQTAEKGGIFMAEPVLAEKTAQEMKEIINDLLQQRSEQMGNKHLSSDIATLMVYVQTDNPTAEETQVVKDLGVVKNFVENNMQYKKWYAQTPQDEIRRLSENTVKHDMNGLPEKTVHIDLDTPYIVAFPDDIKPNDPNANKTLGELMKQNDGVMWDAEFWGDRVGTGEMTVSENFITQVIATQRSEVLEEITTCGNVPFTKEHIEALYEREPELIQEVANDYNEPKIKALAKEVVETTEIGLKKQAFNNAFALFQVEDKINALEKRLQKQPNMIGGQTELKELKYEQGKLEEEYDKLTNRAFDAGVSLTKIRNGAKRQYAEFSGKPIQAAEVKQDALEQLEKQSTSMQQLVDKLDKAYPINKGEPFVKLGGFFDSDEKTSATLSITATELFFREVDKYDKRHTIDDYAFFDVKIVDNDGKELKNGDYDIVKTEDIIENHSGLFGFLLNKNSFSPNPQQEKADENLALALSDYLDDKVKNELPAYLEKIADYKALPSVTGVVSLASKKEAQAIRAFNERLQEHLQNKEVKRDALGLPETTEPRLGDKVILQNGVFYPVISRIADEKFSLGRNAPDKDFIDTIKTNGEIPVSVDEYKQIAKMKNELWYCENTKEFVFMGGVENNYVFRNIRNEEYYGLKEFLQQLKDRQPETVKTLNPKEQALEDGKRLNQAAEKVKNAQWACAKKPNDKECYDNLKVALAEQAALNEEIKPRVQAAMDSGKPYITEYTEDGKPLELVVTQSGTLRPALGSYDKEPKHNHLLCTINGEVALNAEQRSTPERVAEVLKDNFNDKNSDISDKLALINYPAADRVFSENQIKDTLNKALKSSFKEDRLGAIKSPVMRGEWLQSIAANPKALDEIRQAAKNVLAERQKQAAISGFSFDDDKPQATQSPQSPQASTKDDELLKQLCKPDFVLRKAALNDPEISVNLLKRVIDNHKCPQTRNVAKAVLEQRQGGGVGMSQPQSNTRSIAGATPKAAAPKPKASMSM